MRIPTISEGQQVMTAGNQSLGAVLGQGRHQVQALFTGTLLWVSGHQEAWKLRKWLQMHTHHKQLHQTPTFNNLKLFLVVVQLRCSKIKAQSSNLKSNINSLVQVAGSQAHMGIYCAAMI